MNKTCFSGTKSLKNEMSPHSLTRHVFCLQFYISQCKPISGQVIRRAKPDKGVFEGAEPLQFKKELTQSQFVFEGAEPLQ